LKRTIICPTFSVIPINTNARVVPGTAIWQTNLAVVGAFPRRVSVTLLLEGTSSITGVVLEVFVPVTHFSNHNYISNDNF